MKHPRLVLIILLGIAAAQPIVAATILGPTSYLSSNDSPFKSISSDYFYLEDFEDGALNTPGVTANKGSVAFNNSYVDSVDADDGLIDGSGTRGHSWALYNDLTPIVSFVFDRDTLGKLPTFAGLVWTDVGAWPNPNFGNVTFSAFDGNGLSLGQIVAPVGDGYSTGQTGEDRFLGVIDTGGISKITMSMAMGVTWEVDHLQYGAHSPAPVPDAGGTVFLLGMGIVALIGLHRRTCGGALG